MLSPLEKLGILADAAKYDASCASSGTEKRKADAQSLGSTSPGMGICHAYAPDGRCISLLKVLLTNYCSFDCHYCVNRVSSNVPRARFSIKEIVDLTLGFYRRNMIEGLFLSSGIIQSPDYTMEQVVAVARSLRTEHGFRGYIHLKTIPDADPLLLAEAGRYADRLSINVELPEPRALAELAPQKDATRIRKAMGAMRLHIDDAREAKAKSTKAPRFAPAGQSTQMIVGAEPSTDADIIGTSQTLYASYGLSRVYYSAFSPIPDASRMLPLTAPPLMREHRLYQADWLLRFYGYTAQEINSAAPGGMLDLTFDPKMAWALENRGDFPIDINTAAREKLLRVPGLGVRTVERVLDIRKYRKIRIADLAKLCRSLKNILPFVVCTDWRPKALTDSHTLRDRLKPDAQQLTLL